MKRYVDTKPAKVLTAGRPILLIASGLVLTVIAGAASVRNNLQNRESSPAALEGAVVSPDKKMAALISEDRGKKALWIIALGRQTKAQASSLALDAGATNPKWSPDSQFIAFESYNLEGHSPMTTNHVWVVDRDGANSRQLRPPPPNEHFSTYIDKWVGPGVLQIRSTQIGLPHDVFYLYNCKTGSIGLKK